MKKNFLLLLVAISIVFAANSVFAQEADVLKPTEEGGFLIGPIGGLNLVNYSTSQFAILNSEPTCFTAQNGSDVAPFFGLTAELPLGSSMQNFIIVEAIYDSKSSKFTDQNASRSDIPTKINGNVQNGNITTSLTATLAYLDINLGYKYNFTEGTSPVGPGVQLCISPAIKLSSTLNKTVTVSAASPTGGIQSNTATNAVPVDGAAGIRIAFRAQFTYDIPLSLQWILTPTAGYDLPITKVDNTSRDWRAAAAYGGVALRYFIGK